MIIICFILAFVSCVEILLLRRYLDDNCDNLVFEDHISYSSTEDVFCSDFIVGYSGSMGIFHQNETSYSVRYFEDNGCTGTSEAKGSDFVYEQCVFFQLKNEIIYTKVSLQHTSDISPSSIPNSLPWFHVDLYNDDSCLKFGSSEHQWNQYSMSMGKESPVYVLPFIDDDPFPRFLTTSTNSSQIFQPRCNETHIFQFIYNENNNNNNWKEMIVINNGCFQNDYGAGASHSMFSYRYYCNDEYVSETPIPTSGWKDFINAEYTWNPTCYGRAFEFYKYDSAICKSYALKYEGGTRQDFFVDPLWTRVHYFSSSRVVDISDPICDSSEMTLICHTNLDKIDEDNVNAHCRHVNRMIGPNSICGKTSCFSHLYSYDTSDQTDLGIVSTSEYFITLHHSQTCDYFVAHPKEMDEIRERIMGESPWKTYYHQSLCISVEVEDMFSCLLNDGFYGRCENGIFHYTFFQNDTFCSSSSMEERKGDLCRYNSDTGTYITFTCHPYHCNGIPEYSDEVCSSHGVCINHDVCECDSVDDDTEYYYGEFCENHFFENESTNNALLQFFTTTVIPFIAIIILVILCCGVCFFYLCGVFCICFLLTVSTLCSIAGGIFFKSILQEKKINMFNKLENFDHFLKEQMLENDPNTAHLKIDKSLFEIPFDEVEIVRRLGSGGSRSVVYLSKWKRLYCAFKLFKTNDFGGRDGFLFGEFEREVKIQASLGHPYIVQFFGATLKPPRVGILMEYCEKGEILKFFWDFRKDHGKGYSFRDKIRMSQEIVQAGEYLHSRNIIHRDIKPENILLNENESVKLMDFGISRIVKEDESRNKTSRIGTNFYMSPEIFTGSYDHKCDIYSFGILLWVLFSEIEPPYEDFKGEMFVAMNPNYRPSMSVFDISYFSSDECEDEDDIMDRKWIREVILSCWKHDASDRPDFTQLDSIFHQHMDSNQGSEETMILTLEKKKNKSQLKSLMSSQDGKKKKEEKVEFRRVSSFSPNKSWDYIEKRIRKKVQKEYLEKEEELKKEIENQKLEIGFLLNLGGGRKSSKKEDEVVFSEKNGFMNDDDDDDDEEKEFRNLL